MKTPTRFGVERAHQASPRHEAASVAEMVRSGQLTIDQARALIGVNEGETVVLRKILEPGTADSALTFRKNVLRLFNALVQPARTRGKVSVARRR